MLPAACSRAAALSCSPPSSAVSLSVPVLSRTTRPGACQTPCDEHIIGSTCDLLWEHQNHCVHSFSATWSLGRTTAEAWTKDPGPRWQLLSSLIRCRVVDADSQTSRLGATGNSTLGYCSGNQDKDTFRHYWRVWYFGKSTPMEMRATCGVNDGYSAPSETACVAWPLCVLSHRDCMLTLIFALH